MTDVDHRILDALMELIRKNEALGKELVLCVSDWRTASSHRWNAVSKAKVASWFGFTTMQLDTFLLHKNWHRVMDEFKDEGVRCNFDIDVKQAIKNALTHLDHDYRFIDELEAHGIAHRSDEVALRKGDPGQLEMHIQNKKG
jgi:hypothetical protein